MNPSESIVENALESFPRAIVDRQATPLESLPNLTRRLGGAALYVKRDDLSPLAFGGNKVRQLEYYFGEALAKQADTVLITGAVQSNFARLTAAFAAKFNLQCHIQLEDRVRNASDTYRNSGNVLLDRVLGAKIHYFPEGEDEIAADDSLHRLAIQLRRAGRNPYVIPLALGHKPLGALGYVRGAAELLRQLDKKQISCDRIYVASGSGSTHAGLLYGLKACGSDIDVVGVCVRRAAEAQFVRIRTRCSEIEQLLALDVQIQDTDIVVLDDHFHPGYGKASAAVWDAIVLAARTEGLIADPTYTGKTMAAFIDAAKAAADAHLIFLHTGGTPGLFAYQDEFDHYAPWA